MSGFLRASQVAREDFDRFDVGGIEDSIETCLQNVDQSDIVLCVLDRRYGGVIPAGRLEGKSATFAEVERAREQRKPMYFFIRDKAELDYRQLRRNADYESQWVEPKNAENRRRWLELADIAFTLPTEGGHSNWRDQFASVVDLKTIALKRIVDFQRQRSR